MYAFVLPPLLICLLDQRWNWCALIILYIHVCLFLGSLTAGWGKWMQAFEMKCYQKLLKISYKDHVNHEDVCRKTLAVTEEYDKLMTMVKKWKLRWFDHISRSSGFALDNSTRHRERKEVQKECQENNIKEWIGIDIASTTRAAEDRTRLKDIVVEVICSTSKTFGKVMG